MRVHARTSDSAGRICRKEEERVRFIRSYHHFNHYTELVNHSVLFYSMPFTSHGKVVNEEITITNIGIKSLSGSNVILCDEM